MSKEADDKIFKEDGPESDDRVTHPALKRGLTRGDSRYSFAETEVEFNRFKYIPEFLRPDRGFNPLERILLKSKFMEKNMRYQPYCKS